MARDKKEILSQYNASMDARRGVIELEVQLDIRDALRSMADNAEGIKVALDNIDIRLTEIHDKMPSNTPKY